MEIVRLMLANDVVTGVLLGLIVFVAAIIVKKTKTEKDDKIFAMAVNAFNLAEKVIPDASGPAWLQKTDAALKVFIEQYKKREGKEPTQEILEYVKDQWALLAAELKKK